MVCLIVIGLVYANEISHWEIEVAFDVWCYGIIIDSIDVHLFKFPGNTDMSRLHTDLIDAFMVRFDSVSTKVHGKGVCTKDNRKVLKFMNMINQWGTGIYSYTVSLAVSTYSLYFMKDTSITLNEFVARFTTCSIYILHVRSMLWMSLYVCHVECTSQ